MCELIKLKMFYLSQILKTFNSDFFNFKIANNNTREALLTENI